MTNTPARQPQCKHENTYIKNGIKFCDDCMMAWEITHTSPPAPDMSTRQPQQECPAGGCKNEATCPEACNIPLQWYKISNSHLDRLVHARGLAAHRRIEEEIRNNCHVPYFATHTSPPAPDKPKFSSEDLLLLAHDEWKRREERKHLHNEQDWISGFIGGFLTDPTWARKQVDTIRANAEHPSTKGGAR